MNPEEKYKLQSFLPKEIKGWQAQDDDRTYDQESIFDYIDGSGEVYRSYNFISLLVRQFVKSQHPAITVDFFDMGSSEDAFGVFTHDFQDEGIGIGQGSSYLAGSLAFWKKRYFVSIWTEEETDLSKKAVMALGQVIAKAIPEEGSKPELLKYLPPENLVKKNIRYFHNHIVLNYHYFVADGNILNLNQETNVVLAEYTYEGTKSKLLLVRYLSSQQAEKAFSSFIRYYLPEATKEYTIQLENGKWTSAQLKRDAIFILFDAPTKDTAEKMIKEVENNLN